ncbi:unnamed protein product, partial [Prorocentrum cordatum]
AAAAAAAAVAPDGGQGAAPAPAGPADPQDGDVPPLPEETDEQRRRRKRQNGIDAIRRSETYAEAVRLDQRGGVGEPMPVQPYAESLGLVPTLLPKRNATGREDG